MTDIETMFLKALNEAYQEDKTKPGVLVSFTGNLEDSESSANLEPFYASVQRFAGYIGKDKFVECSAKGKTRQEAIQKLAAEWAGSRQTESFEEQLKQSLMNSTLKSTTIKKVKAELQSSFKTPQQVNPTKTRKR